MSGFNFTTTIHGKENDYIVRTLNFDSIHKIVINLNDKDKVIHTQEIPYDGNLTEQTLMDLVKKQHDESVERLQELMKISAKLEGTPDPDSNHKLGLVFLSHGMGKETINELKRALAHAADNVPIMNHLGLAFMLEDKIPEAIQVFKHAVELKPNYPDLHNNFGMALLKAASVREAATEFDKALAINDRYAEAHINMTLALVTLAANSQSISTEDKQRANRHLQQAIEGNPEFNNEYLKVAQNYMQKEQWNEARQALIESKAAVLTRVGNEIYHEFYLRLKYGDEGVDRRSTERYIAKLEEILDKHPNYVDIHNDLGVAYLIQCRFLFNRAINEFKRALGINENYIQAKKNLKLAENEGKGFLILLRAILYF